MTNSPQDVEIIKPINKVRQPCEPFPPRLPSLLAPCVAEEDDGPGEGASSISISLTIIKPQSSRNSQHTARDKRTICQTNFPLSHWEVSLATWAGRGLRPLKLQGHCPLLGFILYGTGYLLAYLTGPGGLKMVLTQCWAECFLDINLCSRSKKGMNNWGCNWTGMGRRQNPWSSSRSPGAGEVFWGLFWCPSQVLMLDQHGWRQNKPVHSHIDCLLQFRTLHMGLALVLGGASAAQQMWQRHSRLLGPAAGPAYLVTALTFV